MDEKYKKVKLKGNESFNFREGWLRKGMRCVAEYPDIFSRDDAMERLGVGSKMVKSIRFWMQATGLSREIIAKGNRSREHHITPNFGALVMEWDPYFDDIFTLWLLHVHIVSNNQFCVAWNIFFNEYHGQDFLREDMTNMCRIALDKRMEEGATFSASSFEDDCSSILKMYLATGENIDPEESLQCPLTELDLLKKSPKIKNAYIKIAPSPMKLDKLIVLYVITKNLDENKNSVSIDDLLYGFNNIGHLFHLNRSQVNEYLDQLRVLGYLSLNRTAGLDMVYIENKMALQDIMVHYYKNAVER